MARWIAAVTMVCLLASCQTYATSRRVAIGGGITALSGVALFGTGAIIGVATAPDSDESRPSGPLTSILFLSLYAGYVAFVVGTPIAALGGLGMLSFPKSP